MSKQTTQQYRATLIKPMRDSGVLLIDHLSSGTQFTINGKKILRSWWIWGGLVICLIIGLLFIRLEMNYGLLIVATIGAAMLVLSFVNQEDLIQIEGHINDGIMLSKLVEEGKATIEKARDQSGEEIVVTLEHLKQLEQGTK